MTRRRLPPVVLVMALALVATACSGGEEVSAEAGASTTAVTGTTGSGADAAGPDAGTAVPSGEPLLAGLPAIEVLAPTEGGAGDVPLFRWAAVDGAQRYHLSVLGPDGPIWAWQGEATEIRLGGLPVERPAAMGGPVIMPATCWSVAALDIAGHVIAVSALLPVSPREPAGHSCVPGSTP